MKFWDEFCEFGLPILVMVFIVIGSLVSCMLTAEYLSCKGFGRSIGRETRFDFGCYVKVDGDKWVPRQYVFGNANEIRVEVKKP